MASSVTAKYLGEMSRSTLIRDFLMRRSFVARTTPDLNAGIVASSRREPSKALFDYFADCEGHVSIPSLQRQLARHGLRQSDPRLRQLNRNIDVVTVTPGKDLLRMDEETFGEVTAGNLEILLRAFRGELVVPEFHRLVEEVEGLYRQQIPRICGRLADYIPQLARGNPDHWGVSICTVDGQRHSEGDAAVPFCLQSCCKPLTYAIASTETSSEFVHNFVGREPSGRKFNVLQLDNLNKPHNPMNNAGGIVVAALVQPSLTIADRFHHIISFIKRLASHDYVGFNNATFQSERQTADRNFALAYYLREHSCFPPGTDVLQTLDLYFQLCSIEVTCESASVIAATLANGGIDPFSGERVLDSSSVRDTLSLMHSCGMLDYSGNFAFSVGLPAKSGVSGGLVVVVPNVMGICLYSPPLDEFGNSVRGLGFAQELVNRFNLHPYEKLVADTVSKPDPTKIRAEKDNEIVVGLLAAAIEGDCSAIRRIHGLGCNVNARDYDNRSALHLAASEGHLRVVEMLVEEYGAQIRATDRWGNTPVDEASRCGHQEVLEYLTRKRQETVVARLG